MSRRLFARYSGPAERQVQDVPFDTVMQMLMLAGPKGAMKIPVVRRSVMFHADRLRAMPLEVTGPRPVWLDAPNPWTTYRDLISMCVLMIHLYESGLHILGVAGTDGTVVEVHVAQPHTMRGRIRDDKTGIDWYVRGALYPGPVAYVRKFAVPGSLENVSSIGALGYEREIAVGAKKAIAEQFWSGANFDVVISSKADVGKEAMEDLADDIEEQIAGPAGFSKPLVTSADVRIARLSPSMRDRQLRELSLDAQAQIATLGFGIHPELVGIFLPNQSSIYRNSEDAALRIWRDSVRDLRNALQFAFSGLAGPRTDIHINEADELRGSPKDRANQVNAMVNANKSTAEGADPIFTDEEIRGAFGFSP